MEFCYLVSCSETISSFKMFDSSDFVKFLFPGPEKVPSFATEKYLSAKNSEILYRKTSREHIKIVTTIQPSLKITTK